MNNEPKYTSKAAPEVSRRYFYTVPDLLADMEDHHAKTKEKFVTVNEGACLGWMSLPQNPEAVHVWWLISLPRVKQFTTPGEHLVTLKEMMAAEFLKTEEGRAKFATCISKGWEGGV